MCGIEKKRNDDGTFTVSLIDENERVLWSKHFEDPDEAEKFFVLMMGLGS